MKRKTVILKCDRDVVLTFDRWLLDEEQAGRKQSRQSVLAPELEKVMRRIVAKEKKGPTDERV